MRVGQRDTHQALHDMWIYDLLYEQ